MRKTLFLLLVILCVTFVGCGSSDTISEAESNPSYESIQEPVTSDESIQESVTTEDYVSINKELFSTENVDANLAYPIGILSEPERYLMSSYYAKTGKDYWGISPATWKYYFAYVRYIDSDGSTSANIINAAYGSGTRYPSGARPVVALKPDVEISGEGTYSNPYVIVGSN